MESHELRMIKGRTKPEDTGTLPRLCDDFQLQRLGKTPVLKAS
ncbi:hypothetical protein N7456_011282 [Penicillium angulare]|uniref:Uncharacterized protein n=1 Tax=Penicillium angulare TaxID=116970 RepID=A0A9W9ETI9_9EURO|nr:hypothetical protein N7456_011282 [Penicillium angulare]